MTELPELTEVFVNSRKKITPQPVEQPFTVAFVTVLFVAPFRRRMVGHPVLVFSIMRLFVPSFLPLIVIYFAPLISNNPPGPLLPEIVRCPVGNMVREVHMPAAPVR